MRHTLPFKRLQLPAFAVAVFVALLCLVTYHTEPLRHYSARQTKAAASRTWQVQQDVVILPVQTELSTVRVQDAAQQRHDTNSRMRRALTMRYTKTALAYNVYAAAAATILPYSFTLAKQHYVFQINRLLC